MLTVVIVSYNSDKYLTDCLDSIIRFNDIGDKLEVIIVDNARSIKTKNMIGIYDNVIYLENSNNGFGSANNVGALHSKNQFLLFLNPDTVLIEPIFDFAIKQFLQNTDLRAFGMILVDERGNYQETFGFFPEKLKLVPEKFYLPLIKLGYTPPRIFPWGANLFVRKADFFQAGMFDENIFMCYEEPDLVRRLPKGQVKIFPQKIVHKAGHSDENLRKRYEAALKSERYYFSKYGLNYKKYVKNNILRIKLSILLRKLFFMSCAREILLLELYDEIFLLIVSDKLKI
jgi:GT2 family glycosyltransferase